MSVVMYTKPKEAKLRKKPVLVVVDLEVVEWARSKGINFSATLEAVLREEMARLEGESKVIE